MVRCLFLLQLLYQQQQQRLLFRPGVIQYTIGYPSLSLSLVRDEYIVRIQQQTFPFSVRACFSFMILPQVHLRKPCYDFYFL